MHRCGSATQLLHDLIVLEALGADCQFWLTATEHLVTRLEF